MSKYICKDCGTGFAVRPPYDCPACSSGNIESDSVPEKPSGTQTGAIAEDQAVKKILLDMAEEIHGSAYSGEIFTRIVDRTIERLKRETVKA